jgi:5'-nucleotidase
MTFTLLTNDDGVDSPAIQALARALGATRDVRVVAPDRERSWVGKAITRFEPVTVKETVRAGVPMHACSGYPADAVQLGVGGLFGGSPQLVISGINFGYNHGAAFLVSSGTVGAAIEGWVSGIPSIAFSTGTAPGDQRDWHEWRRWVLTDEASDGWQALAQTCAVLADEIAASGVFDEADVITVNLPFDATADTPRRVTRIARVGYDPVFRHVGEGIYVHDFNGVFRELEDLSGTDVGAAHDGLVSITPVRMPEAARLQGRTIEVLERRRG